MNGIAPCTTPLPRSFKSYGNCTSNLFSNHTLGSSRSSPHLSSPPTDEVGPGGHSALHGRLENIFVCAAPVTKKSDRSFISRANKAGTERERVRSGCPMIAAEGSLPVFPQPFCVLDRDPAFCHGSGLVSDTRTKAENVDW